LVILVDECDTTWQLPARSDYLLCDLKAAPEELHEGAVVRERAHDEVSRVVLFRAFAASNSIFSGSQLLRSIALSALLIVAPYRSRIPSEDFLEFNDSIEHRQGQ
jgi:hypothetical protein